jgi:hypothetical protein
MKLKIVPINEPKFAVLLLSDLHKGNIFCNDWALRQYFKIARQMNDFYKIPTRIILGGDLAEMRLRNSKGKPSDQNMNPGDQLDWWQDFLEPCVELIDGIVDGNHESRIQMEIPGMTFNRSLVKHLNKCRAKENPITYDENGVFLVYKYIQGITARHVEKFTIYASHGASGAALPGGKLNAAQRRRLNASANVIFTGHVHQFTMTPGEFYQESFSEKQEMEPKEQWTVTNGSCLNWGGYAEDIGYQAGPIVQTLILVDLGGAKPKFDIQPIRPTGPTWLNFMGYKPEEHTYVN